jgi:hypothetical protein
MWRMQGSANMALVLVLVAEPSGTSRASFSTNDVHAQSVVLRTVLGPRSAVTS